MRAIEVVNPPGVYVPPTFSYSHAVRIGDLVFVAGQVAQDAKGALVGKGDPRRQTEQVFENLRLTLEAAGSGLEMVGKVTVLTTSSTIARSSTRCARGSSGPSATTRRARWRS